VGKGNRAGTKAELYMAVGREAAAETEVRSE
jgi:hypothetical protein